jgi:hypothetical protein
MKFKKEDPKLFTLKPEGDYLLEVVETEKAISNGAKTRGIEQAELKCKFVRDGGYLFDTLTVPQDETLDDETRDFLENRVNTFLVSTSFPLEEGESINADMIADMSPGLRGWARVIIDEYNNKKKNKVLFWYTDKEKFPRTQTPAPAPATEEEEPAPWAA